MKIRTTFRDALAVAIVTGLATAVPGFSAQADTFGFGFQLGNSATSNVVGTNYGGVRFTAIDSITIDTLSFGLNNGSGSVEFALQADDGFGNPSGVDLAAGTAASGSGFKSATITPTALVAGTVYHVVARPISTGAAGLRVILGPTVADIHTRDGSPAPNAAQDFSSNAGSTWSQFSFDSRALIWGVSNSTTNQAQGQPYTTAVTENLGANIYRGQTFNQNTGQDVKVNSITVSIARNTGTETTAGDVLIRLLEADTLTEVFSDTLLTPSDIAVGASGFLRPISPR